MKPRTSMGHRTNSSLCVGFMVVSHSHGTIQVITCNTNTGWVRKPTCQLRRDDWRRTDEHRHQEGYFYNDQFFRVSNND